MADANIERDTNDEKQKSEMTFRSWGLLTFWILPVSLSILYFTYPISWVGIFIVTILFKLARNIEIPILDKIIFNLSRLTYGAAFSRPQSDIIRVWWFLLFGGFFSGFLILVFAYFSIYLIPLVVVLLLFRKEFLRFFYFVSFFPNSDNVHYQTFEERIKKQELLGQLSREDRQYSLFFKPTQRTNRITYLLIAIMPLALASLLVPLRVIHASNIEGRAIQIDFEISPFVFQLALLGYVAVIPYLLLYSPLWKNYRPTKYINSQVAEEIIKLLVDRGFNSLPKFQGEYFIEQESEILDMSHPTGFLEILKNGRWMTIIITPIALISIIIRFTVINVLTELRQSSISSLEFLNIFRRIILRDAGFYFGVLIIVPILLVILFPLIFSLNDAEIKRAKWKTSEGYQASEEIIYVQDVGDTIHGLVSIVLGIGTILNLANSIQVLLQNSSTINTWMITITILIYSSVLILPGTFFFVYSYMGSGDHSSGVNYLRYNLSQSDNIGVGTVVRGYSPNQSLGKPPENWKRR